MRAVNDLQIKHNDEPITIEPGSLLEHFYVSCSLNQLIEIQNAETPSSYLLAWNVTEKQFQSSLDTAIELVRND